MGTNISDIPFDQYSRQRIAKDMIDALRATGQKFSILDVGGYKGNTNRFLNRDHVTVVDVVDASDIDYVKASGLGLPFKNASFDIVCSFDALEHIPDKNRKKFINEMIRVSKYAAIVACPFGQDGSATTEYELALNNVYKILHGENHRWLQEHIDNKLPTLKLLSGVGKTNKLTTSMVFSNRIESWGLMQEAIFLASSLRGDSMEVGALNAYYNKQFETLEIGIKQHEAYRVVYFYGIDKKYTALVQKTVNKYNKSPVNTAHTRLQGKAQEVIAHVMNKRLSEVSAEYEAEIKQLKSHIINLESSASWKLTSPLRRLNKLHKSKKVN